MNLANRPPLGPKTGKPINGTKAGSTHMGKVAALRCVCCDYWPVEVHHCRSGGQLRDDFKTIPLCFNHHRGPDGYHTNKRLWEATYGLDTDYLAVVADAIAGELTPWK